MKFVAQVFSSLTFLSLVICPAAAQERKPQGGPAANTAPAVPASPTGNDAQVGNKQPPKSPAPPQTPKLDMSKEAVASRILTKQPPTVRTALEEHVEERNNLVNRVLTPGGVKDVRAIEAIRATPRHTFIPDALRDQAYLDMALPIGEAQTISSPYIVSVMTEALDPMPKDKVLEIGTGSGYQAAVLSPLVKDVYTIEIVESIGLETTAFLKELGYENIHTKIGDGFQGWTEHAPFQKIIVTCSPESVPQPLIDQLDEGGLMVIPVGTHYQQQLHVFKKQKGKLVSVSVRPTLFVPMTGEAEDKRVGKESGGIRIINGDFEEKAMTPGIIPGWYYEFNAKLVRDAKAPSGKSCVEFSSQNGELPSVLIQGFKLDGRETPVVRLKGAAMAENVKTGKDQTEAPIISLQLLDENRDPLGTYWLGAFVGTHKWKVEQNVVTIPPACREAIIRIGLFGATGTVRFDGISVEVPKR